MNSIKGLYIKYARQMRFVSLALKSNPYGHDKSDMNLLYLASSVTLVAQVLLLSYCAAFAQAKEGATETKEITSIILHHDSLFWQAYNRCDVDKMAAYFTDDVEFYHDRNGMTTPKIKLEEATRNGLCNNPNSRLRREQLEGTVKVFPMNNYGALITGEHVFYVNEPGKAEYLDGYGKFTHLWLFNDDTWKMSRIISYDHGPPPYVNKRKKVEVESSMLQRIAGKYKSASTGIATIVTGKNELEFVMGDFQITMVPESDTKFFAKDRDLQFEFVIEQSKVTIVRIYERGKVVDELKRL